MELVSNYPITTSMQFLIDTGQRITAEEQEALKASAWKREYMFQRGVYKGDYPHDFSFGWHTEEDHDNHNFLWVTVYLKATDPITYMDSLDTLRTFMMLKAYGFVLAVLNPMRGND